MNLERIERVVYCSIGHSFMNRRIRRNVLCNIRLLERSPLLFFCPLLLLSHFSSPSSSPRKMVFCVYICSYFNNRDKQSSFVEIRERELSHREKSSKSLNGILKPALLTSAVFILPLGLRKQKIYMQDSFLLCCIFNTVG